MVNLQEIDITTLFPKRSNRVDKVKTNDILEFFASRRITHKQIAGVLKVSQSLIHYWFNVALPLKWEAQLQLLMAKIIKWEHENQRTFGT